MVRQAQFMCIYKIIISNGLRKTMTTGKASRRRQHFCMDLKEEHKFDRGEEGDAI